VVAAAWVLIGAAADSFRCGATLGAERHGPGGPGGLQNR
jgi:hypothetical protein